MQDAPVLVSLGDKDIAVGHEATGLASDRQPFARPAR
jgi:hypothetical protein